MPYEEIGERKVILKLMVLLYNFSASKVGINEILNTFMMEKTNYYGNRASHGIPIDGNSFLDSL